MSRHEDGKEARQKNNAIKIAKKGGGLPHKNLLVYI